MPASGPASLGATCSAQAKHIAQNGAMLDVCKRARMAAIPNARQGSSACYQEKANPIALLWWASTSLNRGASPSISLQEVVVFADGCGRSAASSL